MPTQYVLPQKDTTPEEGGFSDPTGTTSAHLEQYVNENVGTTEPPTHDSDSSYISVVFSIGTIYLQGQAHGIPEGQPISAVGLYAVAKCSVVSAPVPYLDLYVLLGGIPYPVLSSGTITSTDYLTYGATLATNPATGSAWQTEEVRRLTWVVVANKPAGQPSRVLRVTQSYATIDFTDPTWTTEGSEGSASS